MYYDLTEAQAKQLVYDGHSVFATDEFGDNVRLCYSVDGTFGHSVNEGGSTRFIPQSSRYYDARSNTKPIDY